MKSGAEGAHFFGALLQDFFIDKHNIGITNSRFFREKGFEKHQLSLRQTAETILCRYIKDKGL